MVALMIFTAGEITSRFYFMRQHNIAAEILLN